MSGEKASIENVAFVPPEPPGPAGAALLQKAAQMFAKAKKPDLVADRDSKIAPA